MSKFDRLQELIETDFRAICNWVGDSRERRVNPRNLAVGFCMLGEMEHSHRWFQITLHESKTTKFRDWKYFGKAYLATTREGQAMKFFKEALDANPSDREFKREYIWQKATFINRRRLFDSTSARVQNM
jgi:hypothetical protein